MSSLPSAAIIRQRVPSTATLKFVGQTILRALGYLHYASDAGIIVTRYQDRPVGVGAVENSGAGRFTSAILRPEITVRPGTDIEIATAIHQKIHSVCFIARSVNFPVSYDPEFVPAD
nr:hypothetical protein [Paracoccus sp. IB05]